MNLEIVTLESTPILGIRGFVRMQEIGPRIGELMPELMEVAGAHVAGAPLARWHGWEGDQGEMELAVPVTSARPGSGRVTPSALPEGKAIEVWHVGPYDHLHATWGALRAAMAERGLASRGAPWEQYVDDCSVVPVAEVRTRIVWPVH